MCSVHGALFEPGTGYCVAGPCAGRMLDKLQVVVEEEEIVVYREIE